MSKMAQYTFYEKLGEELIDNDQFSHSRGTK